ncbi:MAG: hypothetical protein HY064_07255 [Bacteroidetes bacterium]|nr:hypothetical protein [Bacteroidota bacterium]
MKSRAILFTVLLLPTIVYIYFALGVPKTFRAPFFGPRHSIIVKDKNGNDKTDTSYFAIPSFTCHTVGNTIFNTEKLSGHLYVAVFVNPDSLTTLLPSLAEDLHLNREKYKYARFVFFYPGDSLGNVTPSCPDFGKDLKLNEDSAISLYLSPATFDSLHAKYYFVPDPSRKKDPWQTWSDAILIDHKGRIRGYYNIRMASELKKLKEDVPFINFRDEAAETIDNSTIEKR